MKLAIATDDFITVTGHIGRCGGFLHYEIQDDKIVSRVQIENYLSHHKRDGERRENHEAEHSHSHSRLIKILNGCSHLICKGAGWRVVEDLKQNNIEIVFTKEEIADNAALKFSENALEITDSGICKAH